MQTGVASTNFARQTYGKAEQDYRRIGAGPAKLEEQTEARVRSNMLQSAGADLMSYNPDKMTAQNMRQVAQRDSYTQKLVDVTTMLGK